jgi:hypothetical protein
VRGDHDPLVAQSHRDLAAVCLDFALVEVHGRGTNEGGHEEVGRVVVESLGRLALLELAVG